MQQLSVHKNALLPLLVQACLPSPLTGERGPSCTWPGVQACDLLSEPCNVSVDENGGAAFITSQRQPQHDGFEAFFGSLTKSMGMLRVAMDQQDMEDPPPAAAHIVAERRHLRAATKVCGANAYTSVTHGLVAALLHSFSVHLELLHNLYNPI